MKNFLVSFAAIKLHRFYCPIYILLPSRYFMLAPKIKANLLWMKVPIDTKTYEHTQPFLSIKDLPSQLDLKRITAQHLRPYKSSQQNHILSNQTIGELRKYFRNWKEYLNRWGFSILPIENQPRTSSVTHHPKNKHLHNILSHNATHRIKLQHSSTNHNSSH